MHPAARQYNYVLGSLPVVTTLTPNPPGHEAPLWDVRELHANFAERAVSHFSDSIENWLRTRSSGVTIRPIEVIAANEPLPPRVTALLRFEPNSLFHLEHHKGGSEIIVLEGALSDENASYGPGSYLRVPVGEIDQPRSDGGCLAFVKLGQIDGSDAERRVIATREPPAGGSAAATSAWLPGPVPGTEVLPLHGHGKKSMFMIRWFQSVFFKPGLDPQGEELFVVAGRVYDRHGSYGRYSWVRNPVPAWQSWGGDPGTVVYYKHGHFAAAAP